MCELLVGADKTAVAEVEDSVLGITQRYEHYQPKQQLQLIAELEQRLDEQRRANAAIAGDLRALRERETHHHSLAIGDYDGTAQQIAQRLARHDSSFEWIPDSVAVECESPLTNSEATRFLEMLRYLDASKIESLEALCISSEDIPFPEEFGEFVQREEAARTRSVSLSDLRTHHAYQRIRSMDHAEQLQVEQSDPGTSNVVR